MYVKLGHLFLVTAVVCTWTIASGFSSGPPPEACGTLSPNPSLHGAPPQESPPPYEVDLSSFLDADGTGSLSYSPGETYQLSLSSASATTFRGFILQGRLVADGTTPVGAFTVTDEAKAFSKLSSCSPPNISVVHNDGFDKTSITALWTAPPAGTGPVRIGYGVVMTRTMYWANQFSDRILERGTRRNLLLPFGAQVGDTLLPSSLDGSSLPLSKPGFSTCPVFGEEEDTIYVNANGVISFGQPFPVSGPVSFPTSSSLNFANALIAPFWADHDVTSAGQILYRFTEDESLLSEVGTNISDAFATDFSPTYLFIATWDGVPSFGGNSSLVNTYQAVLATDGNTTYAMFLYRDIQWSDHNIVIGFDAGDQKHGFNVPESFRSESVRNLVNTSNVGIPGAYYFRVDQEEIILPPGFGVFTLIIISVDEISVTELDEDPTNVMACILALVEEPFYRDAAIFEYVLSNTSTASPNDFSIISAERVVIPAGFSGEYQSCINIIVFGDTAIEGDETVVYELRPLSNIDRGIFLTTTTAITIHIIDNDVPQGPIEGSILLPFGEDYGDQIVPTSLDGASPPITFSGVPFYGATEDTLYVNTNGVLSFRREFSIFSGPYFPLLTESNILIALFWADHDIQIAGQILYRLTEDESLLIEVGNNISDAFATAFTPGSLFIATWNGVPTFGGNSSIVNTYQAVIATDGNTTYALFLYENTQWGDSSVVIGFNAGDNERGYNIPVSFLSESIYNLPFTSNVGIPGAYYFRVDQEEVILPPGYGVFTLIVISVDEIIVLENGNGNSTDRRVSACIRALVEEPFHRDAAIFEYVLSNTSTATIGSDFRIASDPYAVVPAGFSGEYKSCVDIVIFGDNTIEDSETVVYDLRQVSNIDRAVFATNATAIIIHILNDDFPPEPIEGSSLLPYGVNFGDLLVSPSLDGSSPPINVTGVQYFGTQERILYVNTNGIISFREPFSHFDPMLFPTFFGSSILIAPFWADHDVQAAGQILYRFTEDESLLVEVGTNISAAFSTDFSPQLLFIATWNGVPPFGGNSSVVNTYQAVIATDGNATYVLFLYADIQWGSDQAVSIGFDAGDFVRSFNLPEISTNNQSIINLESTSNVGIPGAYYFRVDQTNITLPLQDPYPVTTSPVLTTPTPTPDDTLLLSPSQFVSIPGGSANFICIISPSAIANDALVGIQWLLNDTLLDDLQLNNVHTIFHQQSGLGSLAFSDISPSHNMTTIRCTAEFMQSAQVTSNVALLLLQGTLPAVGSLNISPSGSNLSLAWIAPFTLDINGVDPDVTYCVDVVNSTSSSTLHSECGITETQFSYPTPPDTGCYTYTFTVTPVNVVGQGEPNTVSFEEVETCDGVTLFVLTGTLTVLEPASGEDTNPTACFMATLDQPLGRDAMFELVLSNLTTATLGVDFLPNETSSFLTIPGSFSGEFFRCIVFTVFGDDQYEESDERVVYYIRAVSPLDSVGFTSTLLINIINNDDPLDVIEFEQSLYEVSEDVGLDNLALRVCIKIVYLNSARTVRLTTVSETARGDEDYVDYDMDLSVKVDDDRACVGIIILEDTVVEGDESFEMVIEDLGISTTVIIQDDDVLLRYVGNSPFVHGDTVSIDLSFGGDVVSATCALLIGNRVQNETDCSSGRANITILRARNSEYTPSVTLMRNTAETIVMDVDRNIRLGVRGRCSVHLINEGVTTTTSGDGDVVTTIEWGLSAPSDVVRSQVGFRCSLDTGPLLNCTSPMILIGSHVLTVSPTTTGGCEISIGRVFSF